jgi:hypothetical protein
MTEQTQASDVETQAAVSRTLWHRLLGKELELALTPVGITVLTEVQVSSNPPKADIVLLRRLEKQWTVAQLQMLPDGVRKSQASHILIEFKYRETIQEETFQQALSYDYFYLQGQQLPRREVETFIISGQTPRKSTLQAFGFQEETEAGVYRSSTVLVRNLVLIVLNELSPDLHNAFVQCFASRWRVREVAFRALLAEKQSSLGEALWNFLAGLQTHIKEKGGEMSKAKNVKMVDEGLTPEIVMETGRRLRKALIANLTLEERLGGLTSEALIAQLTPEERLAGLAPEDFAVLLAQIEAYLRTHSAAKPKV